MLTSVKLLIKKVQLYFMEIKILTFILRQKNIGFTMESFKIPVDKTVIDKKIWTDKTRYNCSFYRRPFSPIASGRDWQTRFFVTNIVLFLKQLKSSRLKTKTISFSLWLSNQKDNVLTQVWEPYFVKFYKWGSPTLAISKISTECPPKRFLIIRK